MKLEPIIQSEVSQKDKDHYSILTHIMEFRKMVMITLYAKQKKRHRCTEQTFGLCEVLFNFKTLFLLEICYILF